MGIYILGIWESRRQVSVMKLFISKIKNGIVIQIKHLVPFAVSLFTLLGSNTIWRRYEEKIIGQGFSSSMHRSHIVIMPGYMDDMGQYGIDGKQYYHFRQSDS